MKQNRDWKLITIAILVVVLVGVFSWVCYGYYQAKQRGFYIQGLQDGQLQGQMGVINAIQTTGYFAFNVADQNGQPQQIVLVGQLTTPQQLQQTQTQAQQAQAQ